MKSIILLKLIKLKIFQFKQKIKIIIMNKLKN